MRTLVETVWGSANASTNADIIAIGVDYFNQGGNWADALLYLARHTNNRDKLTDTQGLLQLTKPLVVGETGWSANAGNNQLFGGDGLDMAGFVGTLNDYTLTRQNPTTSGLLDLQLIHLQTGSVSTLHSVELLQIGGEIYGGINPMLALAVGEAKPLAEFVQLMGVAELQALGVPAGWLG